MKNKLNIKLQVKRNQNNQNKNQLKQKQKKKNKKFKNRFKNKLLKYKENVKKKPLNQLVCFRVVLMVRKCKNLL